MTAVLLFADFNDIQESAREAATPAAETTPDPHAAPAADIRRQAWTEGYLTARRAACAEDPTGASMARLLSSLDRLRGEAAAMAESASLGIATLILDAAIAIADDDWSASLPARVRVLMDRIGPALTVAPEFVLRETGGAERRFADIGSLILALDGAIGCEDVTMRWPHGSASIGRDLLLEDLRDAVRPLSAGLVNEQNSRQPS